VLTTCVSNNVRKIFCSIEGQELKRTGKPEMHTKFWSGNLSGRDHLGNLGVDGRIVFEEVFESGISKGGAD
jgi:hypothetical protein